MLSDTQYRQYFVDEAGDLSLFDKKGRVTVGSPGVSQFFMVGVAHIAEPEQVTSALYTLRSMLLAHPRYKSLPSMQASAKKTAIMFHAKDDYFEIREKVFEVIKSFDVKVCVAIRRKVKMAEKAKLSFGLSRNKLRQDAVYDDLVKRLFKNLLHKADIVDVVFAKRGKTTRDESLRSSLKRAQHNFSVKTGKNVNNIVNIKAAHPSEFAGLQVTDYYLWALQRLCEREEGQYFNSIAGNYRLIMDLDDVSNKNYGEWYSDSNPLTLDKFKRG